jgi:diphosphomevalonate decarboxylase
VSASDFPIGAGLASSASAFAALTVAAARAAGLSLTPTELSRLARHGSGSACRSIFGGFVEWLPGADDRTSFAAPLAGADHWALADLIAIVSGEAKPIGSSEGHRLAPTSPLQAARVATANSRIEKCRGAVLRKDFALLAAVVELDSHMMHAVMQTSTPPLLYWSAASITVMTAVRDWRLAGLDIAYTLDAGPNVHCLCPAAEVDLVSERLLSLPGVIQVLQAGVGAEARLLSPQDPLLALL